MGPILRCVGLLALVHGGRATKAASEALGGQCTGSACQSESEKASSLLQRNAVMSPQSAAAEEDPLIEEAAEQEEDPKRTAASALLSKPDPKACTECPKECEAASYKYRATPCVNMYQCRVCPKCYGCMPRKPAPKKEVVKVVKEVVKTVAPKCPRLPDGVKSCEGTKLGPKWFSKTTAKGGVDATIVCASLGYDGAKSNNCRGQWGWKWEACVVEPGKGWCSGTRDAYTWHLRSAWRRVTWECTGEKSCEGESKCPVLFAEADGAKDLGKGSRMTTTTVDACAEACHTTVGCGGFAYSTGAESVDCFVHGKEQGEALPAEAASWQTCVKDA